MKPAVVRYLPEILCDWIGQNGGRAHELSEHQSMLLFADTSGFTALTRNLSLAGRVGFEHLTDLLNTLFHSLETVIVRHDGDILKFSGDAVWCCFPQNTDILRVYGEMLHQIELLNREQPICAEYPLSLHAGASSGAFSLLTVQSGEGRAEFEICGEVVVEAYRACDIAKAGEICVTHQLVEKIRACKPARMHEDFGVFSPDPVESKDSMNRRHTDARRLADESDIIKYLPAALVERMGLAEADEQPGSEHRRVSVVFANVQGGSTKFDGSDLRVHLAKIMNAVHESNGVIARIDPFGSGHKVLALFGAIVASGGDSLRALKAAAEIAKIETPGFVNRLGLASGPLLCGEVGSSNRREFTVMGNAVNLAARLMSKADPAGLLIDEVSIGELGTYCCASERKVSLKGFDLPVSVFAFESLRETQHQLTGPKQFYGRQAELEELNRSYQESRAGGPVCVAISGLTGIGKTSLAAVFAAKVNDDDLVFVDAASSHLRSGGWLIYELLKKALGCASQDEFSAAIARFCEPEWIPLLESLSGAAIQNSDTLRDVSPELRIAKTASLANKILGVSLGNKVIILDNLESLDTLSAALLRAVIAQLDGVGCLFVLIDSESSWDGIGSRMRQLNLEGLAHSDLRAWLSSVLVPGKRESDLTNRLIEVSAGNPLLIEESLQYLSDSGALAHISDVSRFDVVESVGEVKLSGRLEELQLARFDRLPEESRAILKSAAIFPVQFTLAELSALRPDWTAQRIEKLLSELLEAKILTLVSGLVKEQETVYRFSRSVLRETIYNRTPVLQLQEWHRIAAERLVSGANAADIYQIAYHFAHADRPTEAFRFNLRAAQEARDAGLPLDASRYLLQCEESLKGIKGQPLAESERLKYFRLASSFYSAEGNYSRAYANVRKWRRLAKSVGDRGQWHDAVNSLANLFWKQSRYNHCSSTLKYVDREFARSDPALLSDTLALQGELFRRTGKVKVAQDSCKRAVDLAEQACDPQRQAQALNNLGLAHWTGGNLDEAVRSFEKCLSLHEARNARYLEARVANNLAIISEEKGAYIRARELANRAREIFAEFGDRRNQSYASGNLANLQMQAGRFREALDLFTIADRIFVHLGEMHPHHYTIGNLADIDLVLGRITEAGEKYQTVLSYAKSCGDKELEAETAVRLTECAFYGGETAGIRQMYENAISIAKEVGSVEYQTRGTIGLCRYLIGIRDTDSARTWIEQLESFAATTNSLRSLNEALFLQGELARISELKQESIVFFQATHVYASEQEQFELLLKSLVRLAELDQRESPEYMVELALLLDRFSGWNGCDTLRSLLSSRYYGYFQATLKDALKLSDIAACLYSVG